MKLKKLLAEYNLPHPELWKTVNKAAINNYLVVFERDFLRNYKSDFLHYYEWMSRSYRCSKHILASALFYCQSHHLSGGSLTNLATYTMYYALHHTVSAVMVLLPHIKLKNLEKISHGACLTWAKTELVDRDLVSADFQTLYNVVLTLRETFSYQVPLGSLRFPRHTKLPTITGNLTKLDLLIPALLQLADLLSCALHEVSSRRFSDFENEKEFERQYEELQSECDEIFARTVYIEDRLGTVYEPDDQDHHEFYKLIKDMRLPYPQSIGVSILSERLEDYWWEPSADSDFNIHAVLMKLAKWNLRF